MTTQDARDQRRHQRYPVGITLDINAGGSIGRFRGTIAEVSASGMTFKTDAELEEGMTLHLKLPNKIDIRGEVRSAGRNGNSGLRRYGVRFHKIGYSAPN